MKKHLQLLFSCLLFFGLTVNQGFANSQRSDANHYRVSYVQANVGFSQVKSDLYHYAGPVVTIKAQSCQGFILPLLKNNYSAKVKAIFKEHSKLSLQLHSTKAQQLYLCQQFSSGDYFSMLYIA